MCARRCKACIWAMCVKWNSYLRAHSQFTACTRLSKKKKQQKQKKTHLKTKTKKNKMRNPNLTSDHSAPLVCCIFHWFVQNIGVAFSNKTRRKAVLPSLQITSQSRQVFYTFFSLLPLCSSTYTSLQSPKDYTLETKKKLFGGGGRGGGVREGRGSHCLNGCDLSLQRLNLESIALTTPPCPLLHQVFPWWSEWIQEWRSFIPLVLPSDD